MGQTQLEEDRAYLENFWDHRIGSLIETPSGLRRVAEIDPTYPEQVRLEGDSHISYIQDFNWHPENQELDGILQRLGIAVYQDSIGLRQSFLQRPTTWAEYAQAIRTFRNLGLLHGEDLLEPKKGMLN
jgi:hypothetical protein